MCRSCLPCQDAEYHHLSTRANKRQLMALVVMMILRPATCFRKSIQELAKSAASVHSVTGGLQASRQSSALCLDFQATTSAYRL